MAVSRVRRREGPAVGLLTRTWFRIEYLSVAVGGIALALAGNALMIAAGRMADEEKDGLGALAKELLPPESGEAAH